MKTVKLQKDGKSILVNVGSQREKDLRKLGWNEKGTKPPKSGDSGKTSLPSSGNDGNTPNEPPKP